MPPMLKAEEDDPDWRPEGRRRERWTVPEIITFLGLLKNYPELYKRKKKRSQAIHLHELKSLMLLLKDSLAHQLPLDDVEMVQKRIANVKAQFKNALCIYRKNIVQGVVFNKPSLRWFKEASFLDHSGLLDMTLKPEVRVTRMQPISFKTLRESAMAAQKARNEPDELPDSPIERYSMSYSINGGEDIKQEEDVVSISDDEDESVDYEEFNLNSPEINPSNTQPPTMTSKSTQISDDQAIHSQFQSMNYFLAFLEYTKIRSEGYSKREKRRIMDVVTLVMNLIDGEHGD